MNFDDFLTKESVHSFFQDYWGKNFLHYGRSATALNIENPQNLLERILEQPRLRYPQVRVLCEGGALSPLLYTKSSQYGLDEEIDANKVLYFSRKPNTVKVENLASLLPEFRSWEAKLTKLFSSRITLNGYFSFGPSGGIPIHFDPHHIFAVQLYGQKKWSLGANQSQTFPHKAITFSEEAENLSMLELTLNAGDMLYLPPGRTHSVQTENISIHVAIGIHTPRCFQTIADLVDGIVESHPELRADQPFSVDDNGLMFRNLNKSEVQTICDLLISSVKNENLL
ncbi:JmjC domain-containing protein [Pelagibaculum spongiae]|uniref:JmjC domain-containing protein n=1 Tax=Pelagibaculum spongiae TaxID=2080658 RepID=A0A2V1GVT4_9GAMM|nr:cupin domain-containing protein [Pelagibaculum spongiae]PVZ64511.1 hypothetical protein DC094_19555 [Pelagibaculum spongiae]